MKYTLRRLLVFLTLCVIVAWYLFPTNPRSRITWVHRPGANPDNVSSYHFELNNDGLFPIYYQGRGNGQPVENAAWRCICSDGGQVATQADLTEPQWCKLESGGTVMIKTDLTSHDFSGNVRYDLFATTVNVMDWRGRISEVSSGPHSLVPVE